MKFLRSISRNKYIFISILAFIITLICIRLVLNKENKYRDSRQACLNLAKVADLKGDVDNKEIKSCQRSFTNMSETLSIKNYNKYIKCLESIPNFEEYEKCSDYIDEELDKKFGFPN